MQNRRGFTLLELLLAVTMLGILGLGIFSWTRNLSFIQKGAQYRLSNQSDVNQVFQLIKKALRIAYSDSELVPWQVYWPAWQNGIWTNLNIYGYAGENAYGKSYGAFLGVWNPNDEKAAYFGFSPSGNLSRNGEPVSVDALQTWFYMKNFAPYARLKDLNGNGIIDDTEKQKFEACINALSSDDADEFAGHPAKCFDGSVCNLTGQSWLISGDCQRRSFIPYFELSEDRKIVYISVRPVRNQKMPDGNLKKIYGPGVTKALVLE